MKRPDPAGIDHLGDGEPPALSPQAVRRRSQLSVDPGGQVHHPLSEIGGGYGGYNQNHEFFGYRLSI